MCEIVPEKRGVVFRTKGPQEGLQYVFRIPLPHIEAVVSLPLCGVPVSDCRNQRRRVLLCLNLEKWS